MYYMPGTVVAISNDNGTPLRERCRAFVAKRWWCAVPTAQYYDLSLAISRQGNPVNVASRCIRGLNKCKGIPNLKGVLDLPASEQVDTNVKFSGIPSRENLALTLPMTLIACIRAGLRTPSDNSETDVRDAMRGGQTRTFPLRSARG